MPPPELRLAIVGAHGRMGQRLAALAAEDPALTVVAAVDRDTAPLERCDPAAIDCVIDFSVRERVVSTAAFCQAHALPLALGTTGLEPADRAAVDAAARSAPLVFAPNYSVGVNALFALAGELASMLGPSFDLEVVEAHHRHKVDAPSGTARRLVELLAESRGQTYETAARAERNGLIGPRTDSEIGVATVRGGDVVGEHTVFYLGAGEQISLTHRATDRDVFARGALRAAAWLAAPGRRPGRYDMLDVLRTP